MSDSSPYVGKRLFVIWGIPVTGNNQSLGFLIGRVVIGLIIALIFWWGYPILTILSVGIGYGVLIALSLILHITGHLVGGKFVNAPMQELYVTPQLIETRYHENPQDVSKRTHLIRTLAGVFMTLAVALISALLWRITQSHWWLLLAVFNLIIGAGVSLPFNGVDGEVIWRETHRDS